MLSGIPHHIIMKAEIGHHKYKKVLLQTKYNYSLIMQEVGQRVSISYLIYICLIKFVFYHRRIGLGNGGLYLTFLLFSSTLDPSYTGCSNKKILNIFSISKLEQNCVSGNPSKNTLELIYFLSISLLYRNSVFTRYTFFGAKITKIKIEVTYLTNFFFMNA